MASQLAYILAEEGGTCSTVANDIAESCSMEQCWLHAEEFRGEGLPVAQENEKDLTLGLECG